MLDGKLLWACALAALLPAATCTLAQDYPQKPIRFVIPYNPGGAADPIARMVGQKLSETWGQPVIMDNRAGAGGNIGTEIAVKSPPDGYTIVMVAASTVTINQSLYSKLAYDPARDLVAIGLAATDVIMLVQHPSLPVTSITSLIRLAKARPKQINYASGGTGSGGHLAMELFKAMTGVDVVHIPYRSAGDAMPNLIAGQVTLMFTSAATVMPHVRSGRLKALAVTSSKRVPTVPDLPTIAEAGVRGYEVTGWYGVLAPARTPPAIVAKLNTEIARIVRTADVSEKLTNMGLIPSTSSPEELAAIIEADAAKWAKVVKQAGIRAD